MLFTPKRAQVHYMNNRTSRDLLLKARQLGFSTLIQLDHLHSVLDNPDIKCGTIANTLLNAQELFNKIDYAFNNLGGDLPDVLVTETNNTSKLSLAHVDEQGGSHPSSILVSASARSSTLQRLHVSEFAHMTPKQKSEVMTGSMEAVPDDGYSVIETTANGEEEFYDLWKDAIAGKNEYTPHFYNWMWEDQYEKDIPIDREWKREYTELAKSYGLIKDIQERFNINDRKFYFYFQKARNLKEEVKQEYPSTWEEAFLTTGSKVFSTYIIQQLETSNPVEYLENGNLKIWQEPQKNRTYCIGVDTSEGDINSDYGCAGVLDVETGEQVAELHGRWKDNVFARKLAMLGKWYNNALIGVERNNHGHSVLNSLDNAEVYPNIYVFSKKLQGGDDKMGFLTSSKTKPIILTASGGLVEAVENKLMKVNSSGFLSECRIFKYLGTSRRHGMGAEEGKYDDRVMAWAIAWFIRLVAVRATDKDGKTLFVA